MKPLTGALINNFYLMNTRLTRIYLLAVPALIALYMATGNETAAAFLPFTIVLGIPAATFENASVPFSTKWTAFENSWSLAPHFMVISRYILYVLLVAIGVAVWLILPFEFQSSPGSSFTLANYVVAGLIMCAVFYPVMYLLNPKSDSLGIVILFATMFIAFGLTFGLYHLVGNNIPLTAAAVVVSFIVSIVLSVAFNAMHRGRVA